MAKVKVSGYAVKPHTRKKAKAGARNAAGQFKAKAKRKPRTRKPRQGSMF